MQCMHACSMSRVVVWSVTHFRALGGSPSSLFTCSRLLVNLFFSLCMPWISKAVVRFLFSSHRRQRSRDSKLKPEILAAHMHTPRTPSSHPLKSPARARTCVRVWERKQNLVGMRPPIAPMLSESGSLTRARRFTKCILLDTWQNRLYRVILLMK